LSIERVRDHEAATDADTGVVPADTTPVAGVDTSAAHLVLALVGLDPIALLFTPDVVMAGRR
jgi:hypothetical protein